jgi:hypothetical protein
MHPTDEDLILHFYGEGDAPDESRIDEHLRTCVSCQAAFAELRETLQMVDAAGVPEPDAGFERVMWTRVQQALPKRSPRGRWTMHQWLPVTAWAAVVVAVVSVGFSWWLPRTPTTETTGPNAPSAAVRSADVSRYQERVLLTALDAHFQQTEILLVELLNAPEDGTEFSFERASADDLVASGRLYRVTAQQSGNRQLAQMLDDLESVLIEVARSPEKPTRGEFASIRERVDDNGLLFKVRAVTNEIRNRQETLRTASE